MERGAYLVRMGIVELYRERALRGVSQMVNERKTEH
jgi:hypothetical protein